MSAMQNLTYKTENYSKGRAAVGLIVLQSDEVLESELRHWLPGTIDLFHSRIPSADEVTEETLAQMEEEIIPSLSLLPKAVDFDVIAYCCTSGTTVIGETKVAEKIKSIFSNVATTNPLTAVKANLTALGARRIGLLTPYEPHVSQAMADHLNADGFEISSFGAFNEKEEAKVTRISRASILAGIEAIGVGDLCDAVFASCTYLRMRDILDEAEQMIGKPVISSNSALAWHIQQLTGQNQ